jgi:hypothetical protein
MPRRRRLTLLSIIFIIIWANIRRHAKPTKSLGVQDSSASSQNALCVIANIFNPAGFRSRYKSYDQFRSHIESFGARLITVELAFGNQTFKVTNPRDPNHVQLRTDDVMWYKENLINIGIRKSPSDCEYVAWIDLEVEILNTDWVRDTVEALDKFKVVQLYEVVRLLGPERDLVEVHHGKALCFRLDDNQTAIEEWNSKYKEKIKYYCSVGYGWAARKKTVR